jgi:hypothetical protein
MTPSVTSARGVGLRERERLLEGFDEGVQRFDELIGGELGDDGVRIAARQDGGGPGDGVERVAPLRLAEQVRARQFGQVGGDVVQVGGAGHDQDAFVGDEPLGTLEGQPQQAAPIDELQQLLGGAFAGQRPQAGPRAARHDHDVAHRGQGSRRPILGR